MDKETRVGFGQGQGDIVGLICTDKRESCDQAAAIC